MSNVPPAIEYLLETPALAADNRREAAIEHLVATPEFLRDLLGEATRTAHDFRYRPRVVDSGFSLQPSGPLHPMSPFECVSLPCRRQKAQAFAQVAALYSDTTVLTDRFTHLLRLKAESGEPWTPKELATLAANILTVRELEPLIKSGAIQFSAPEHHLCSDDNKKTMALLDRVAEQGLELIADNMTIASTPEQIKVTAQALGKGVTLVINAPHDRIESFECASTQIDKRQALLLHFRDAMLNFIRWRVAGTLVDCHNAAESGATVAAKTEFEILASKAVFEKSSAPALTMNLAAAASINLPWIPQLSITELVWLRERACHALPNFRLEVARSLQAGSSETLTSIASALQGEIPGLHAELRAALTKRTDGIGPAAIVLGLAVVLCGIATANPLVVGSGVPFIAGGGAMWTADKAAQSDEERARTKPAYVLLSARELLQERH
ncbi:hypothetical protein WME89_33645 [Sorangium sp. So ce321]|uniref:hypothetical protein n=1 Tax=Sorangium sp. So ce321 TaxID=3133300 RepID=UPI003F63EA94